MNQSLGEILDFSACQNVLDYKNQFNILSDHIIRNCIFEYKNFKFRITDLELGVFDPGVMYFGVHCREIQTKAGYWYVQTKQSSETFKTPQYMGLDITCGFVRNDGVEVFATILIKGIQAISEHLKIIENKPAISFNAIFYQNITPPPTLGRKWDDGEKLELSRITKSSIWDGPIRLISEELNDNNCKTIISSPESFSILEDQIEGLKFDTYGFRKKIDIESDVLSAISKVVHSDCSSETTDLIKDKIVEIKKESIVPNVDNSFSKNNISTTQLIKDFLNSIGGLKIGTNLFSKEKLIHLKSRKDIKKIPDGSGCYFIFTNLSDEQIPSISADGYACFENKIGQFKCIYNGKAESLKSRLTHHLFNNHTLEKVRKGKNSNLSSTGGMSLSYITNKQIQLLENEGIKIKTNNLKPFKKSLHPKSYIKDPDGAYFINGINIEEDPWAKYEFAVIVIKTDNELGKALLEEGFVLENGRPPLCKRFG